MNSPLITTKLYTPRPRQNLVSRPHLLSRASEGLAGKLLLISAPAGYGKTTLMAAWCAGPGRGYPLAWLSLEEEDNDPARFLAYLTAALQQIGVDLQEDMATLFQGSRQATDPAILSLLINELATVSADFALVLEDYHVIERHELHQMMSFLLDHLPPQMHLVIITRLDPPFPLARLRARGQLSEVRARNLRFTLAESTAFLHDVMNLALSDDVIQTFHERTEGWIAALQLAALTLQGRDNPSALIATFGSGHDYLVDYLAEEVLDRQPESLRMFLLQTSILNRMNGPLCDALTDRSDSEATLAALEKSNLFVSPMDSDARWYRYHHLFAHVVASHLQRIAPEQLPELHRRAAKWYAQNNYEAEAIEHYLAAMDYEAAAAMLNSKVVSYLTKGSFSTLLSWFDRLPDEAINQHPRLNVYRAWGLLLAGKTTDVECYIAVAEEVARSLDEIAKLRGDFAAIRAYAAAMQGNMDQAFDRVHEALAWLADDNDNIRAVMAFVLGGVYYMRQDMLQALNAMQEAGDLGQRSGNLSLALSALSAVGSILVDQGDLRAAEKTYEKALALGTGRSGKPLAIAASVYSGLAKLHLVKRDLKSARSFAQTGVQLGEQWSNADSQVGCHLVLAQVAHLECNRHEAQLSLSRVKELAATHTLTPEAGGLIAECEAMLQKEPADSTAQHSLPNGLSEREVEVLQLFAEGLSNQEIAERLIISLGTVKAHSSHIYQKLDVRNRAQAVMVARELKLIDGAGDGHTQAIL